MTEQEFDRWVAAYILYQSDPDNNRDDHPLFWAVEKFFEIIDMDEAPKEYFEAILEIVRRNPGDKVLGVLAAGPLEDLIHHHGPQYIDLIENEAKTNPAFKHLLGGVWESSTPEIWSRIEKARGVPW